ncbi:MAG: HAMP domain-containing protein [Arcobacteraceae bacterium]|nr:HAMP domain-containing protein [Arcobacteraceae bacterium]
MQFYKQNIKTVDNQLLTIINEINYNQHFYTPFDDEEFLIQNFSVVVYHYKNNKFNKISSNNSQIDINNHEYLEIGEIQPYTTKNEIRVIRYRSDKDKTIYIEVATTLKDKVEPAMVHLKNILIVLIPILLFLSIISGYFIIKSSLYPVKKAINEVKKIESHNLDKRITTLSSNDEIEELITTFNFMLDKLDDSFSKIKRFSNDVSHELKTPLTIIRGEIELGLRKDRTNEEYKNILKSTLEETKSLQELINSLLFLSKSNNKEIEHQFTDVELDDIITEVIAQNKKLIETKNIKFYFHDFENIIVQGHPLLLKILIGNIIQNSLKYSHKNSIIDISLTVTQLVIKDYGIGIKEDDLKNIFDRFYRIDDARSGSGYGLGLSIVKSIANIHKFTLEVKSKYEEFTQFTIKF